MKKFVENKKDTLYLHQTSRSSSFLTTLPTLSKIRQSSFLNSQCNSAKSLPVPHLEIMTKVKNRKIHSEVVTPQIVSNTLKKYFIPMLEAQRHRKLNLKTCISSIHTQSLCEFLQDELKRSKIVLKNLTLKLNATITDKNQKLSEIEELKEKLIDHSSNLICSDLQIYFKNDCRVIPCEKEYSKLYIVSNRKKKAKSNQLNIEIIRNSELKDKANELKH